MNGQSDKQIPIEVGCCLSVRSSSANRHCKKHHAAVVAVAVVAAVVVVVFFCYACHHSLQSVKDQTTRHYVTVMS